MKSKLIMILFAGLTASVIAGNAVNKQTVDFSPIPKPVEFASDMDRPVKVDATTTVTLECSDKEALKWLSTHFAEWYAVSVPRVVAGSTGLTLRDGEEAYAIKADEKGVRIAARSLAGVRWAAYVLRQMSFAQCGTLTTKGFFVPTLTVSDAPALGFRCIHLVWLPETRPQQIERSIRLAALFRFNYVIIESWGMYRSEKHPWWGWPDGRMTKAEVHRLVALGKDLGVTLIPQINLFGHASSARACALKHATLDFHPEYAPLFEPDGWNWCLTNPETQRVLRELIIEMYDDFGRPPYFHLGCDEAAPPSCPNCRQIPYGELVCKHITDLSIFLKKQGARAMIWHDMLIKENDERWKGFTACGSDETIRLADTLAKDIIICDWEYESYKKGTDNERLREWPTMAYFKEKGFPVVGCPWLNFPVMKFMTDYLKKINGFGYIQTTWHHLRGRDWLNLYYVGSTAAWGVDAPNQTDAIFARALRMVGQDMKITAREDSGIFNYEIPPSWWIDN